MREIITTTVTVTATAAVTAVTIQQSGPAYIQHFIQSYLQALPTKHWLGAEEPCKLFRSNEVQNN